MSHKRKRTLCHYDGRLIKCEDLLKAEAIVIDSCACDREEVKRALEFIDRHSRELMREDRA